MTMERLITGDFIDGLLVQFDADREVWRALSRSAAA